MTLRPTLQRAPWRDAALALTNKVWRCPNGHDITTCAADDRDALFCPDCWAWYTENKEDAR